MDEEMEFNLDGLPDDISDADKADVLKTMKGIMDGTLIMTTVYCNGCGRKWQTPLNDDTSDAVFECLDCGNDCTEA